MIRILQCVNNMHRAGLETMLMNYYRHIDRDRIQFDFLTHRPDRSDYDDEIESYGGKVFYAPRLFPHNYPAYFRYMKDFFSEHPEYVIVHSHIDAMSYLPLLAAKKAGVPVRVAHSHNTSLDMDFKFAMKTYFRWRVPYVATDYLACGTEAGHYMFGSREFKVIPNAIDTSAFRFDPAVRERIRRSLSLEDKYVIGCVGRLTHQKNISFLIEVFNEIYRREKKTVLLIIGGGEQEEKLKGLVHELNIQESVRFLGVRSDVAELYQAMDVFVMTSLYEGLPVVGIEAQVSDLHCVFSINITREIGLSEKAHFLSLNRPASDWAEYILKLYPKTRGRTADFECDPYDIEKAHTVLEKFYLEKYQMVSDR